MDFLYVLLGCLTWTVVASDPQAPQPVQSGRNPSRNPSILSSSRQNLQLRAPADSLSMPVQSDSSQQVGPIGKKSDIAYQCTFFHNSSYSCKTDCTEEDDLHSVPFPDAPQLKYMDRNCSTDVPVAGATWKPSNGFIKRRADPSRGNQVIATCSFYKTSWFECYGIADCSLGPGVLTCAGGAPWRGYYEGSPEKGTLRGNVTAEAMNSPPVHPTPQKPQTRPEAPGATTGSEGATPRPNVLLSAPKKVVVACEKFVDSSAMCYGFDKTCSGPPEQQICSHSRKYIPRTSTSEAYYGRFDSVVQAVQEDSLLMAADIVAECYFYDNNEYLCGFPFGVSLKSDHSLSIQPTRGRYYRSKKGSA
ncbi:uncharacterized protein LOC129592145 [Paramacrobiotus metropolitanus]|uniref:uncharacterized protein LOC129592145 n=1 Tax=Paramacrobiotus metropolitanus TaxID=2943436 RepID=UPI002445A460|nr:uncharacterized protein LOC129592145 [Paramacrobiotus metropolitanus]